MERVVVNKIIPFSSVDGPGNRTAVFLQGCNINCKYCHNPETRGMCVNCGECVEKCPVGALFFTDGKVTFDSTKCVQCDTCIHTCRHDSSPRTRIMDAAQVYEEVKKQVPFIRGITVSGGECMLHPQFLTELFTLARADGLGTLIDSNGTIDFSGQKELLEVSDGVMLDIKAFSSEEHKKITDFGNEIVLKNAQILSTYGKLYEVRAVIVPTLYDTEQSIIHMAEFLKPLYEKNRFRIKIIAYRPMGVREEYSHYPVPSRDYLEHLAEILREYGFEDLIII